MQSQIQNIDRILLFLITLYLSHNSSFIAYHTPPIVWGVCVCLTFILLLLRCGVGRASQYLLPLVALPIISFFLKCQVHPQSTVDMVANCVIYCIYPLLTYYILKSNNVQIAKYTLFVYLLIEIITGACTIFAYGIDENFVRMGLTDLQEESMDLYAFRMNLNVGDYYTSYGYTALLPLVIMVYKWRESLPKPKLIGILCLIVSALMVYVVYIGQYTIAFMVCLLACLIFFLSKNQNKSYVLRVLFFGIIIALLMKGLIPTLLRSIIGFIDSDVMVDRLTDLANSIEGGKDVSAGESDFEIRMRVYNRSIDSIFKYPLVGAWDFKACGEHSFFLDNIALMGLFGIFLIYIYYHAIISRYIRPYFSSSWSYYFIYSLIIITIFYIFNPSGMYTHMFFVIPISAYLMNYYVPDVKSISER